MREGLAGLPMLAEGWDAEQEAAELFEGGVEAMGDNARVICDDCFAAFRAWMVETFGPGPWPAVPGGR